MVYRPTHELRAYERNARTHPPGQIAQLRASIREFGFNNPILLKDDNTTIGAGHGRWEAATLEGLAEVPTITLRGLTDAQWRAYVIADNKLALGSGWDEDLLRDELGDLLALDVDLSALGFDEAELQAVFNGWDSDLASLERHAENLDGLGAWITVTFDAEHRAHRDGVAEAITAHLVANSITAVVS